jgi:hypothetical protein
MLADLSENGFAILTGVFTCQQMDSLGRELQAALDRSGAQSTLQSRGKTYGSRNLIEVFPQVVDLVLASSLRDFACEVLGPKAGIVRVLYFDKPTGRSWSLPWHRDKTIAVQRNDLPSNLFRHPTTKAGIPHVEAPAQILERMLTLRIHIDAMNSSNGPLYVIPCSHRDALDHPPVELHCDAGDVLAMRPLLSHSSIASAANAATGRRIVHFELAGDPVLPDGYEWRWYAALR